MRKLLLLIILSLLISGCAAVSSAPPDQGVIVASGSLPGHSLGILIDENLTVQGLDGPAKESGVQVGDVLVSLRPTTQIEDVPIDEVKFTDTRAAKDLIEKANIHDNLMFAITILRKGKPVEVTIKPSRTALIRKEGEPTRTPSPSRDEGWDYF